MEKKHNININIKSFKGSGGLMVKVSALGSHGFVPHMGHNHDSSCDTSAGWFQEADLKVI